MSLPTGGLIARSIANRASRISRIGALTLIACVWVSAASPVSAQSKLGASGAGFSDPADRGALAKVRPYDETFDSGANGIPDNASPVMAQPNFGAFDDGFTAFADNGAPLANPDIAVSPDYIVAVASGEIAWYDKNQQLIGSMPLGGEDGLWPSAEMVQDAKVIWNAQSDRFYVVATETTAADKEFVYLAVSSSNDPSEGWLERADQMYTLGNAIGKASIGSLGDGIYLSFPMHEPSTGAWILRATREELFNTPGGHYDYARISNYPKAYACTTTGSEQFLVMSADAAAINRIKMVTIVNDGVYDHYFNMTVVTPWHLTPPPVEQLNGAVDVTNQDETFSACTIVGDSCWAAHSVKSGDHSIVRWYEFDLKGWPNSGLAPTLRQTGDINLGPGVHAFLPDIAVDSEGNAAIVFSVSSSNQPITIARAVRFADDELGTFQPHHELLASTDAVSNGAWGSFVGIEADPVTPGVFWSHAPYNTVEGWKTYISEITLAEDDIPPSDGPRLNTPGDGFINNVIPVLRWDFNDLVSGFRIHISHNPNFTSTVYTSGLIIGNTHQIPDGVIECDTRYYWRVVAETAHGDMMSDPDSRWFERRMLQDINLDGIVDSADLGMLLAAFNTTNQYADFNGDGFVNSADLGSMLSVFGQSCN